MWFDEWEVRPGDSIQGAVDRGLSGFEVFVLLWSDAASRSRWVQLEMRTAVARWLGSSSLRVVPVLLDRTPVPTLLADLRYIDGSDADHLRVTRELLGIGSDAADRTPSSRDS